MDVVGCLNKWRGGLGVVCGVWLPLADRLRGGTDDGLLASARPLLLLLLVGPLTPPFLPVIGRMGVAGRAARARCLHIQPRPKPWNAVGGLRRPPGH